MSTSIMDPFTKNAMRTYCSMWLMFVMIPMVPLHIPCSIRELLRYMTRASCWRRTEEGKFVFDLNILFESWLSHCCELMKSMACEIMNPFLETGRVLQTIVFICWAVCLKPTIWVVFRRMSISGRFRNSECRCCKVFQVFVEILPIQTSCRIW